MFYVPAAPSTWTGADPTTSCYLTNFLHHFDVPTCEQLAAKAYAALAPGGRAITLEFIPEPDRITPPSTANFALVMLATTAHGDAYTFAEFQATFARAGFLRSEFHALPPTINRRWFRIKVESKLLNDAVRGRTANVRKASEKDRTLATERGMDNRTLAWVATYRNREEILKLTLQTGADCNTPACDPMRATMACDDVQMGTGVAVTP